MFLLTGSYRHIYSILFYSILFYSILFYSILFYSILFYSILFYSILFYSILFYSILFYSILFYSIIELCHFTARQKDQAVICILQLRNGIILKFISNVFDDCHESFLHCVQEFWKLKVTYLKI